MQQVGPVWLTAADDTLDLFVFTRLPAQKAFW